MGQDRQTSGLMYGSYCLFRTEDGLWDISRGALFQITDKGLIRGFYITSIHHGPCNVRTADLPTFAHFLQLTPGYRTAKVLKTFQNQRISEGPCGLDLFQHLV